MTRFVDRQIAMINRERRRWQPRTVIHLTVWIHYPTSIVWSWRIS